MKTILLLSFVLVYTFVLYSQEKQDWIISGQIQARSELDGRDFSNKTYPLTFTSLRTRLSVEKSLLDKITLMVQVQDSRVLGEEPGTSSSLKNTDLHQAYFIVKNIFDLPLSLQAGRFEMKYGTERFFGIGGWSYTGRSFDGIKLSFHKGINIDLFGITVSDDQPYISNAVSSTTMYPYPSVGNNSSSLYGFWNSNMINKNLNIDFFGYYEVNRKAVNNIRPGLKRVTSGINYFNNINPFNVILETAIQAGKNKDKNILAYLVSLQCIYKTNAADLGLCADILSGTRQNAQKYNTFETSFGTGHKFFGYMDYFINMNSNTMGLGLIDFYFISDLRQFGSRWNASVNAHYFMSNKTYTFLSGSGKSSVFGQEVDITLKYQVVKGSVLSWGGSVFLPGKLMKEMFKMDAGPRKDPGFWSYLMATISL